MLSREEAEEKSEALLEPKRRRLRKKRQRRRQRRALHQILVGGVAGFFSCGALGDYLVGDAHPWNLVGLGIGILLAAVLQRFPIA